MITRLQAPTASGNSITFGATPTEGNLLVVAGCERSDTTLSISGSGWTEIITEVLTGNTSFRRSFRVWAKLAGASEPTGVTVTNSIITIGQEFAYPGGSFGALLDSASNNNGNTADGASVTTGALDPLEGRRLELLFFLSRETNLGGGHRWDTPCGGYVERRVWAGSELLHTTFAAAFRALIAPSSTNVTITKTGNNTGLSAGTAAYRLTGGGTISGSAGEESARIYAINREEMRLEGMVETDAAGAYSIDVTSGDTYHVAAEWEDGAQRHRALSHWDIEPV
jgi:hypothetical protein